MTLAEVVKEGLPWLQPILTIGVMGRMVKGWGTFNRWIGKMDARMKMVETSTTDVHRRLDVHLQDG